jgi:hypothetical protein
MTQRLKTLEELDKEFAARYVGAGNGGFFGTYRGLVERSQEGSGLYYEK